MNTLTKDLMVKNKYYIPIFYYKKAKNVILATYPKNIFFQPPLKEETFQYYIEEKEILITNLSSKETKKVETNVLKRRILIVCDIFARAAKRGVQPELIIPQNKSGILTDMITLPKMFKKEEKNLLAVLTAAIRREEHSIEKKYKEDYKQFVEILENGGII